MSTQHTPGPWGAFVKDGVSGAFIDAGILRVCTVHASVSHGFLEGFKCIHHEEAVENARLIAAAPDLLKALEDIAAYYPNSWAADTALSAIAKATGGAV